MAAKPHQPRPDNSLDVAKLEQMVEPLTVIIEKTKNGNRSPIPLPIGDSGQAGVGWSKDEVLAIQQGWLVNEWSGGGFYTITVTDDTKPVPARLSWSPFWPPDQYPEKIPPTLQGAAAPRLQIVPQPLPPQAPHMTQFPGGLPSGGIFAPQQPQYAHPQQYAQPYPPQYGQPPQPYNPYAAQAAQADADRRRLEEQLAKTQADLAAQRLETVQRQHQADLDRERSANATATAALEQKLAQIMATLAQTQQTSAKSPEMEQLREAQRLAELRYENERREREAERRETQLKEMIASMAAQTQRQIEVLQQNYQAQMTALGTNKSDPMMQMLAEQNRNFIQALGEISRQSSGAIDKFQQFMMSPRDIMAMQKDSSTGIDALTSKFASVYGNVMDMQQKVIENAMQLNQGGSETIGLIKEGINTAKEAFERYVVNTNKTKQVTDNANSAAVQAQAQAQAIQAQAAVAIQQLQNQPPQPQAAPSQPRPTPAPSNGLGGVPQPINGSKAFEEFQRQRQSSGVAQQPHPGQPEHLINAQGVPPPISAPLRLGATDEQWFGPFLNETMQLRGAVAMYMAGLNQKPPVIADDAATPQRVADGIGQAQALVIMQNMPIPAMVQLLNQGHFKEFLEVLLPDAPEPYRDDIVVILRQKLEGAEPDDGDEKDEDGEEGDDVKDGSTAPAVRIVQPARA